MSTTPPALRPVGLRVALRDEADTEAAGQVSPDAAPALERGRR